MSEFGLFLVAVFLKYIISFCLHWLASYNPTSIWTPHILYLILNYTGHCNEKCMVHCIVHCIVHWTKYNSSVTFDKLVLLACFYLLNLSKAFGELVQQVWRHFYFLVKFTKWFRPVQQAKVLNKDHEDLCWPLIDTHKLIVQLTYLYLVKYKSQQRKKLSIFFINYSPPWVNTAI